VKSEKNLLSTYIRFNRRADGSTFVVEKKKVWGLIKFRGLLSCRGVSGRCVLRLRCENPRGKHGFRNHALRWRVARSYVSWNLFQKFNVYVLARIRHDVTKENVNVGKIFTILIERRLSEASTFVMTFLYSRFRISSLSLAAFEIARGTPTKFLNGRRDISIRRLSKMSSSRYRRDPNPF